MLFKSSAHLLLWAFVALVLIVLGLLAFEVGLFGEMAQSQFRRFVRFLADQYGINRANVQLALQIIGLGFTILIGALGFLRALHYADYFLPQRIQDHMDLAQEERLTERAGLIAPIKLHTIASEPHPVVVRGIWPAISRWMGLDWRQRTINRLDGRLRDFNDTLVILRTKRRACQTERATIHLLRGLELATRAASSRDNEERRRLDLSALDEYRIALKAVPSDPDCLEQAARQAKRLGSVDLAIDHLERLTRVTAGNPTSQARAMRLHAEVLRARATPAALNEARVLLEAAIDELNAAPDGNEKREIELALLHEWLGVVQTDRERYQFADRALTEASRRFNVLGDADGQKRVADLKRDLEDKRREGDGPDDGNSA
jgi:hypothetical protein